MKIYKFDVLKKGFQRPELIPIYEDDELTTFRGSEQSVVPGLELNDLKIKNTKGSRSKSERKKVKKQPDDILQAI